MKQILLATGNPAKLGRFRGMLSLVENVALLSLSDFTHVQVPEEPYGTGYENARYKAIYYFDQLRLPVFVSDETLYLDFLDEVEQPGVMVRRLFGDRPLTDKEIFDHWSKKVMKIPSNSCGNFRQFFCYYDGDVLFEHVADFPFTLLKEPRLPYTPGYPMSAFCVSHETNKVWSEMSVEDRINIDQKKVLPLLKKISNHLNK